MLHHCFWRLEDCNSETPSIGHSNGACWAALAVAIIEDIKYKTEWLWLLEEE